MENSKIKSEKDPINALIALVKSLRGQPGCPWDKKQTSKTMLIYLIEELYELADAIESDCAEDVREELGDVLFHIVFIARLFQETGHFSIDDVARDITEKMIRRHPHVFGAARVDNTDEIRQNWYQIKQNEKKQSKKESALDSVPINLPALMRAYRIGERAARCRLEAEDRESLLDKLDSEFDQLKYNLTNAQSDRISNTFGRLLFSLVNLARLSKIHPETALSGAVKAFEMRFRKMEKEVSAK
ncbi:MAG: nucleoside triphosphate pyrophosphohydrolase [Desulfobacterales bacterium]